jgi:hypothetical protein
MGLSVAEVVDFLEAEGQLGLPSSYPWPSHVPEEEDRRLIASGRKWNFGDDLGDISLIWTLQDPQLVVPPPTELALRYYLWEALQHRHHVPSDVIAEAAVEGDLETLAHISDSEPLSEPTARGIWDVAHRSGRTKTPPPPEATEADLVAAVSRSLPPRWAAARIIAEAGWPEWGEALLDAPEPA